MKSKSVVMLAATVVSILALVLFYRSTSASVGPTPEGLRDVRADSSIDSLDETGRSPIADGVGIGERKVAVGGSLDEPFPITSLLVLVKDQDGLSVQNCPVQVWSARYNEMLGPDMEGVTDDLGQFLVKDAKPGSFWIIARGAGYEEVTLAPNEERVLTLKVECTESLRIRVVDADGSPVTEARLVFCSDGSSDFVLSGEITSTGGEVLLSGCLLGIRVVATHMAHLPSEVAKVGKEALVEGFIELKLERGRAATLLCKVRKLGAPVPKASVRLSGASMAREVRSVTHFTSNLGESGFEGLPEGEYDVLARAPGLGVCSGKVYLRDGAALEHVLELVPGVSVYGEVIDDQGAHQRGMTIIATQYQRKGPRKNFAVLSEKTTTSGAGGFEFHDLPPGVTEVLALDGDGGLARLKREYLPGEVANVILTLDHGNRITGKVLDTEGRALADYMVGVPTGPGQENWKVSTRTDDDGGFALSHLGSGEVLLQVRTSDGGWGPKVYEGRFLAGSVGVVLTVDLENALQSSVRGRVLMEDGGSHGGFMLEFREEGAPQGRRFSFVADNPEFQIAHLASGVFDVHVRAENAVPFVHKMVLDPNQELLAGDLTLTVAGTLVCRVAGLPQEPPADLLLLWNRVGGKGSNPEGIQEGTSVDESPVTRSYLQPGEYEIHLTRGGDLLDRGQVTIPARGTGELHLSYK